MRNAFASEITALAGENPDIVLLSGDIGNRLFDQYKEVAPERFFNCGVAEANMVSAAAGLAMCGLRPVAYTITPFITARCFEQIKIDLCYHNVPVVLVGTGSGLSYASLGATHHSLEDIAILRVLPEMTILCPGDAHEVRATLRAALKMDGPVYIRLGKKGEPLVHERVPDIEIGKGLIVREGTDVCILSTGNMLPVAVECADRLAHESLSCRVVSFHTVKPLDMRLLKETFGHFPVVATMEEHALIGGFGASVAEWVSQQQTGKADLLRFGATDEFLHEAGNQMHARKHFGLTAEQVAPQILRKHREKLMAFTSMKGVESR
jgi:transketolase